MWLGLRYEIVQLSFELDPPADIQDAWWAVRVMEGEALRVRNRDANS